MDITKYEQVSLEAKQRLNNAKFLRQSLEGELESLDSQMTKAVKELGILEETKNILAIVNDSNTTNTLTFVNGVINRVLSQMFPTDPAKISIEKTLYKGQYVHLNVQLTDSRGNVRDIKLQSGTGLKQVVSFLFRVCLIELRGGRRVLFADEILNGVHNDAKRVIMEIIKIFAEEGFQFVIIEHGGMMEHGRVYNIEKTGDVAEPVLIDDVEAFGEQVYVDQ